MERFKVSEVALDLKGLHFQYSSKKQSVPALNSMSFQSRKGVITGILGPNGSGKSTCFKLVATQLKKQGGLLSVLGLPLEGNEAKIREKLGVCFQSPSLDGILTVRENLEIQAALYGLSAEKTRSRISELLKIFHCEDWGDKKCENLSGGQARRVEIMKALIHEPELLLLDEPSNGLDPEMRSELWMELLKIRDMGVSIHVTTHLMEEAELCDDLVILSEGKCVAAGSPESLKGELGFELIYLSFPQDRDYLAEVAQKIKGLGTVTHNRSMLRVESTQAEECFSIVKNHWKDELRRVSWEKPSLGDVYLQKAGRELRE